MQDLGNAAGVAAELGAEHRVNAGVAAVMQRAAMRRPANRGSGMAGGRGTQSMVGRWCGLVGLRVVGYMYSASRVLYMRCSFFGRSVIRKK